MEFFAWAQGDLRTPFVFRGDRLLYFCEILCEIHAKNSNLVPRLDVGLCPTNMNQFHVVLRDGEPTCGFRSLSDIDLFKRNPGSLFTRIQDLQNAKLWRPLKQ